MPINFNVPPPPKLDSSLLPFLGTLTTRIRDAFNLAMQTGELGTTTVAVNVGAAAFLDIGVFFANTYKSIPFVLIEVYLATPQFPRCSAFVTRVNTTDFDYRLWVPAAYIGNIDIQWQTIIR